MYGSQGYENFQVSGSRVSSPTPPTVKIVSLSFCALRLGFFLQLISITALHVAYFFSGGQGLFSYSLSDAGGDIVTHKTFRTVAAIAAFLHLLGTFSLSCFQVMMADDASWTRGFRSGSKVISYATVFDICSGVVQFVLFLHLSVNYSPLLWAQFSNGGPEWLLTTFSRLLHAIAALLYAQGFFLVEAYHDRGTSAYLGIGLLIFYLGAGVLEILGLAFVNPTIAPLIICVALVLGLVWSLAFETELNASAPRLHESELTNEIEAKVEYYARVGHGMPGRGGGGSFMGSFDGAF